MSFWSRPLSDRRRGEGGPWLLVGTVVMMVFPLLLALQEHFAEKQIVAPTTAAAERAAEVLTTDGVSSQKALPVWPPPKPEQPADPAANGMVGALPQHVAWPADLPKADAGVH